MNSIAPTASILARRPIGRDSEVVVRRARIADAQAIYDLINHSSHKGILLRRTLGQVYQLLPEFLVAETDGRAVGCAALHIDWADLAEMRSVAVSPDMQGRGIGHALVEGIIELARELGVERVFCLTDKPDFFQKFEFAPIDKEDLPSKVWRDCIHCPIYPQCRETALIRTVCPPAGGCAVC